MRSVALGVMCAAIAVTAAAAASRVEITQPWSRPAVAGATAAGFMTLANRGKTADALVAVSSPMARKAEIHRSSVTDGVMSMRRQDRVEIPQGRQITFAPGGYHLMFVGLARPLRAGDTLPATLTFAKAGPVEVRFVVGSGAAQAHGH
jgi:periplasmic copper chaperone A